MYFVVVMPSVFTIPAIFRAFVFVLIPAFLVDYVRTFGYNDIPLFKRCFAKITGLLNELPVVDHVLAFVPDDIFLLKYQITDVRDDKLKDEIQSEHDRDTEEASFQDDLQR